MSNVKSHIPCNPFNRTNIIVSFVNDYIPVSANLDSIENLLVDRYASVFKSDVPFNFIVNNIGEHRNIRDCSLAVDGIGSLQSYKDDCIIYLNAEVTALSNPILRNKLAKLISAISCETGILISDLIFDAKSDYGFLKEIKCEAMNLRDSNSLMLIAENIFENIIYTNKSVIPLVVNKYITLLELSKTLNINVNLLLTINKHIENIDTIIHSTVIFIPRYEYLENRRNSIKALKKIQYYFYKALENKGFDVNE